MTDSLKVRMQLRAQWAAARLSYGLVNYRDPILRGALEAVLGARRKAYTSTTPLECVEIVQALRAASKAAGDMAEAGVYLGGTARLMLEAEPSRRMHLFDTFEGLPHDEGPVFRAGGFAGSQDAVRAALAGHEGRFEMHPGWFPESAAGLEALRFGFVHLDLDLYDSTLAALEWFWPRMSPGGVLLSHDYPLSAGVVRAFREFFAERPEPFIPLSGNQCLAVRP